MPGVDHLCFSKNFSMSFSFSDSTYKWDHVVFVFPGWLISLNLMSFRFIHVVANSIIFYYD